MSAETALSVANLTKRFGRRSRAVTALQNVSLDVRRGEVFGLLGRNGAGKTTLVKILLGLMRPTGGEVRVLGGAPGDPDVNRRLGYSPEEPDFPRHLVPRQVLGLAGSLCGLRGTDLEQAVERQLVLAELDAVAGRQSRQLSKGMKQRLSLAQAFLHEPQLLILDEPTADLDPIGRRQVRDLIGAFRDRGGTVFLNSHLLSEVERICDRVAILHRGQIMRIGSLDELVTGEQELEDVFVAVVGAAGGGTGFGAEGREGP